jgi:glycosyltransferase involved in cell wall biosynthesis
MRVIPNGIDTERFSPNSGAKTSVRQELGLPNHSVLIGLIARYHPVKDHATFLRAAARVHHKHPDTRFVFAGEGMTNDNKSLLQLVQENKLQHAAHLLGPRRDVPRLTAALDIACLSSWSESFPNVILEAMACAVPCIATNVGDCSSMIGGTGRIVAPLDSVGLAGAIEDLMAMAPRERAALGQAARDRVLTHFALQGIVRAYEQVYDDCFGTTAGQDNCLVGENASESYPVTLVNPPPSGARFQSD